MHTHRTPFWGLVQDLESGPKSPRSHNCGLSLPCAIEMYEATSHPCLKSCSAFPWLLEEYPNSLLCLTESCTGVAPVPLSGLFHDHLPRSRGPATLAILLFLEHVLAPTLLWLPLLSGMCFPYLFSLSGLSNDVTSSAMSSQIPSLQKLPPVTLSHILHTLCSLIYLLSLSL